MPFTFSGKNNVILKINQPKFEDFIKDLEIYYSARDSVSTVLHSAEANIIYKGKIDKKDADFHLKIDSNLEFKKGFFDKIFDYDYIKYLTSFAQSKNVDSILREKMTLEWLIAKIIAPLNNATIRELEGRGT